MFAALAVVWVQHRAFEREMDQRLTGIFVKSAEAAASADRAFQLQKIALTEPVGSALTPLIAADVQALSSKLDRLAGQIDGLLHPNASVATETDWARGWRVGWQAVNGPHAPVPPPPQELPNLMDPFRSAHAAAIHAALSSSP
jgi:hypothetical protein